MVDTSAGEGVSSLLQGGYQPPPLPSIRRRADNVGSSTPEPSISTRQSVAVPVVSARLQRRTRRRCFEGDAAALALITDDEPGSGALLWFDDGAAPPVASFRLEGGAAPLAFILASGPLL